MKIASFIDAAEDPTRPGLGSKTVEPSDAADVWEGEYARQLVVFAEGAVCFVGADGVTDTWTFTSDMGYPQVIPVAVSKVKSTGTTVGAGNIKAVR